MRREPSEHQLLDSTGALVLCRDILRGFARGELEWECLWELILVGNLADRGLHVDFQ